MAEMILRCQFCKAVMFDNQYCVNCGAGYPEPDIDAQNDALVLAQDAARRINIRLRLEDAELLIAALGYYKHGVTTYATDSYNRCESIALALESAGRVKEF